MVIITAKKIKTYKIKKIILKSFIQLTKFYTNSSKIYFFLDLKI